MGCIARLGCLVMAGSAGRRRLCSRATSGCRKLTGRPARDRERRGVDVAAAEPRGGRARQARRSTSCRAPPARCSATSPRAKSRRTCSRRVARTIPASRGQRRGGGDRRRALRARGASRCDDIARHGRARPARRPAERPRAAAAWRHVPRDPARAQRVRGARDQAARLQGADRRHPAAACSRSRAATAPRASRPTRSP